MPTGGGKSLCFQVPALVSTWLYKSSEKLQKEGEAHRVWPRPQLLDGLTLVVSPLIALMKDQRDALTARGVAAASLDSSLTLEESSAVRQQLRDKKLKILYVAPERSVDQTAQIVDRMTLKFTLSTLGSTTRCSSR